jgi:hypothetical protein
MPEIVSINKELGLILINSIDLVGVADLTESIESVLQIANHHGLNKVMIDATALKLLPSFLHLHSFAYELSRLTPNIKYAIIISKQSPKEASDIAKFAQDRGVIIKVFTSKDDALTWLEQ